jgi:hypothetical protein
MITTNKKITANTVKSMFKGLVESVTNDGDNRHFTLYFMNENYIKVAIIAKHELKAEITSHRKNSIQIKI